MAFSTYKNFFNYCPPFLLLSDSLYTLNLLCFSTLQLIHFDICLQFFSFTLFAMMLNQLTDNIKDKLPPTDSRLRPDIRLLEEGDIGNLSFFHINNIS